MAPTDSARQAMKTPRGAGEVAEGNTGGGGSGTTSSGRGGTGVRSGKGGGEPQPASADASAPGRGSGANKTGTNPGFTVGHADQLVEKDLGGPIGTPSLRVGTMTAGAPVQGGPRGMGGAAGHDAGSDEVFLEDESFVDDD